MGFGNLTDSRESGKIVVAVALGKTKSLGYFTTLGILL